MCGLAGLLNIKRGGNVNEHTLRLMTDSLSHRGPDAGNIWVNSRVGLGHRRLSIIDLSDSANQPFLDSTGNYVIVFNGELYNYQSIKRRLIGKYRFETESDTEVVLYSFIEWGSACLDEFNGMFAFAIWCVSDQKLFIARDRLGIKPLYYYTDENYFLFASELRSIISSGLVPRKLNNSSLSEYLAHQTVMPPSTILNKVYQLEPGQFGFWRKGTLKLQYYWKIESDYGLYNGGSLEQVKEDIRHLFYDAVELRMISDVPLGVFLSGGIDSSAIVGVMSEVSDSKPSTFSIGFTESSFDESDYARLVADRFKTNHVNIRLSANDFKAQLPNIVPTFDSPSGDGANTYIVSEMVKKQGISVALSGLGGDELFAGYQTFNRFSRLQRFSFLWRLPPVLRKVAVNLLEFKLGSYKASRLRVMLEQPSSSIVNIHPYTRRVMTEQTISGLLKEDMCITDGYENSLSQVDWGALQYISQVSIAEIKGYTQNVLLRDTDQMSMAHALEVRVPFFDHRLVEYMIGLPDLLKYPNYPKKLLVESLGTLLPNEVVHRPKMGFSFPWDEWIRNDLSEFCKTNITYLKNLDAFQDTQLDKLWHDFENNRNFVKWSHVWVLSVLGAWVKNNDIKG